MTGKLSLFFLLVNIFLLFSIFQPANSAREATTIFESCSDLFAREECYGENFYKLTKKTNFEFASSTLMELQKIDPKNSLGCHFIAHRISAAETEKNISKWEDVIKKAKPYICSGGFIHGVMEARYEADKSFRIDGQTVGLICNKILNDKTFGERSCNHIMGHLLLIENAGIIDKSVDACNKLNKNARYECFSGVFMENLTRVDLVSHGLAKHINWSPENALVIEKLCNQYDGDAQNACWREISYIYAAINDYKPEGLFDSCNRAPLQAARDSCFIYGIGNAINFPQFEEKNLTPACSVYSTDDPKFGLCTFQIVGSLLASSDKNVDKTMEICGKTESDFKPLCYSFLLQTMKSDGVSKDVIKSLCQKMPLIFPRGKCI